MVRQTHLFPRARFPNLAKEIETLQKHHKKLRQEDPCNLAKILQVAHF